MLPGTKNLQMYRGDSFAMHIRLSTKDPDLVVSYPDLTGFTIDAQIRETEDNATILATFDTEMDDQGDPDGMGGFVISMDADTTDDLPAKGKYDVQVTWPDTTKKTYLRGDVTVTKDVTRP